MIKILFLVNEICIGGASKALIDIVTMLDKEKYKITVISTEACRESFTEFRESNDVRLPFERFIVPKNRVFLKLRSIIINFVEKNRKKYPGLYHRLAIRDDFDIEVAFSFKGIPQIIEKSTNKYSKKVVWIHNDVSTNRDVFSLHKNFDSCLNCYKKFNRVVCVSQLCKDSFEKVFGENDNLIVKYNPINAPEIMELSKADTPLLAKFQGERIICAVGRLSAEKGYLRLVKIHLQLIKKGIAHRLVIVGEGEEEKRKIEKLIEDEGINGTVLLTGYDSNPYKYMAKSDFFVCSSFTEGLPIVCQEALALGVPIVSSFPSVGELFGDETCGILSETDDDSLMAAIEKMLTDEEFYKKCKVGAEKRAEYFDPKNSIKEIEKMFDELLENDG